MAAKKKRINLVDLDKTLIPFDSLRKYFFKFLLLDLNFPFFIFYSLARLLKVWNKKTFTEKIIRRARNSLNYRKQMEDFSDLLFKSIDQTTFNLVLKHTQPETINVISSSSPEDYVKKLAIRLKWDYCASYFDDQGVFYHNDGPRKVKLLEQKFPKSKHIYNFAISDNQTDKKLLSLFKKSIYLGRTLRSRLESISNHMAKRRN